MPWKPEYPGDVPTLGYIAIDWINEMLAAPDTAGTFEPFTLYLEQEDILLDWYELTLTKKGYWARRKYVRGVVQRSRGWGKSPFLAAISILEALGPIHFDGFDANGQPVGKPWSEIRTPRVDVSAVSQEQVDNTWGPLLEMLHEDAPIHDSYPGIEPQEGQVILPHGRGRINRLTSSARTVKGKGPHFVVMDQTEEWVDGNGGKRLATVLRSNAAKVGGSLLESPNAFIPGDMSVAEGSFNYYEDIKAGRARDESLYYNSRSAPATTDLTDFDSLIEGMRIAYGDSSADERGCVLHEPPCGPGHVDLPRLVSTIWDPETDEQVARSDFLNQVESEKDSWVSHVQWKACWDPDLVIEDGDTIVMGFDGSRGRKKGKADATALIGMRVHDGAAFELGVWEAKQGKEAEFTAPVMEVDAKVNEAFERFNVVGFAGDPTGWEEMFARWRRKYGKRVKVKAAQQDPFMAWPRGKDSHVEQYVEITRKAIVMQEISHAGDPKLTQHVQNARKRSTRTGYLLYKKFPMSVQKIDAAYALVLAHRMRLLAVASGATMKNTQQTRSRYSGRSVVS